MRGLVIGRSTASLTIGDHVTEQHGQRHGYQGASPGNLRSVEHSVCSAGKPDLLGLCQRQLERGAWIIND